MATPRSATSRMPRSLLAALATCVLLGLACGCTSTSAARVTAYDIHVQLAPETHTLQGHATLTLRRDPPHAIGRGPLTIEFALNRALQVASITGDGTRVTRHTVRTPDSADPSPLLAIHTVVLDSVPKQFTLTFDYAGPLIQDVQAGERPGEIHNQLMAAHVASEGIYLDSGGGWYPRLHGDPQEPARGELADYRLSVEPVDGMRLVAGAEFDAGMSAQTGQLVWRSRYPLDGLALVGGPHEVKERQLGDLRLALHYSPPEDPEARGVIERHTDMFLEAATGYLERYQPLVGPYPFERFTIVENFFSSGFAFPEFTLLDRRLLQMGPRALRHGFLDHEMLHSWWGNSIYVDPADGNWCEALTSYATNYYGYILDGDEPGARGYRRNACIAFSMLEAEDDRPLGTFGRDDGAGRDIGYQKGAMVLHMLARRIGQDNFWAALRRLTAEHTGKYANWRTFQTLFEQQSGMNLDRFFREWVRSSGAPCLTLRDAVWHQQEHTLEVTLDQGETAFDLAVPLRVIYDDGTSGNAIAETDQTVKTVRIRLDAAPTSVTLDPDYHVFRKLSPGETMPTTRTTLAGKQLLVVKPNGEMSSFYQTVIDRFRARMETGEVKEVVVGDLTAEALGQQSVLILGDAVRSAPVQALLARTDCPITWSDSGFQIDGESYDQPGQSVLCTVHHPDVVGGGITIYCGNSEDALGRSDLLLFYRNSLVVFDTTVSEANGEKTYQSQVVTRRDFESQQTIDVSE
jgi:aminopeptidase N